MNKKHGTKNTAKSQYRYGSVLLIISLAVLPALVVGSLNYVRALRDGYENYNRQMRQTVESIDNQAVDLVESIRYLNTALSLTEDIVQCNGKVTSYINLKPESGEKTVAMIPGRAGEIEKRLYDIMQKFVEAFPSVTYLTLATESDGGILMYPAKARSPGYDAVGIKTVHQVPISKCFRTYIYLLQMNYRLKLRIKSYGTANCRELCRRRLIFLI